MNLDDIRDRLKGDFQQFRERLEESSTYNNLRDRYQSLSPLAQKLVAAGIVGVIALIFLMIPLGHYQTSSESIADLESKRTLLRDLLRVQKEVNEMPEIPVPPPPDQVKSRIDADLATANLLPEQMRGVNAFPPVKTSVVNPEQNEGVVEVSLSKLNLKQVVDIGFRLQNISPSVKLKDLIVTASPDLPGYFEVIYRLLVLKVTPEALPPPEDEPKPTKKGKR